MASRKPAQDRRPKRAGKARLASPAPRETRQDETAGGDFAFLLGLPRSGTTLLAYLLDQHPAVAAPPEPWVILAVEAIGTVSRRHPADSRQLGEAFRAFTDTIDLDAAKRQLALQLYRSFLAASGKSVFVDKTPRYHHVLDTLARWFPEAGFIWLKRNPFAVAASLKASWGLDITDVVKRDIAHPLVADFALGHARLLDFAESQGDRLLVVTYEDLVNSPQAALDAIIGRLNLKPFKLPETIRAQDAAYGQAAVGDRSILGLTTVENHRAEAWRQSLSQAEMQSVVDILGVQTIERLGYGAVVRGLIEDGKVAPRPGTTESIQRAAQAGLSARWSDVALDSGVDGWQPTALDQAMEVIYTRHAAVHRPLPAYREIEGSVDVLAHRTLILEAELREKQLACAALRQSLEAASFRQDQLQHEAAEGRRLASNADAAAAQARQEALEARQQAAGAQRSTEEARRLASIADAAAAQAKQEALEAQQQAAEAQRSAEEDRRRTAEALEQTAHLQARLAQVETAAAAVRETLSDSQRDAAEAKQHLAQAQAEVEEAKRELQRLSSFLDELRRSRWLRLGHAMGFALPDRF